MHTLYAEHLAYFERCSTNFTECVDNPFSVGFRQEGWVQQRIPVCKQEWCHEQWGAQQGVFMTPKCVKKLSCERSNSPRGLKTRDPSHSWMGLSTSWTGWYRWVEKLYLLSVCLRRTVLLLLQWRQTPIQQQALQQRPRPNSGSSEGRTKSTPPKFILLTALCRNINWKTITAAVCLQQMEILMQRNNLQANRKTALTFPWTSLSLQLLEFQILCQMVPFCGREEAWLWWNHVRSWSGS